MHYFARSLLLLLVGIIASLVVAIEFGIHTIIFAWVLSVQETVSVVARTYLFRQVLRPISKRFTEWFIVLFFGRAAAGKFKHWILRPLIARFNILYARWTNLPPLARVFAAVVALVVVLMSDYWMYLIVFAIPIARYLYKALHFTGIDFPFDRWVQKPRRKFRRFIRTNALARMLRYPWRSFVYLVLKRSETARENKLLPKVLSKMRGWSLRTTRK
ncbi:MAG: hypothetical protein JWO50_139 [Candidatus Kaiserbacteria bacterium]|nr:hypothetical protein [Candidatus Kaiserbacteria bacterium]